MKENLNMERKHIDDVIFMQPVSREEESIQIRLYQKMPDGPKKRLLAQRIIRCNSLFLAKGARAYAISNNLNAHDLFSQGKLAMWEALEAFDPSRGHKFISFAVWYMRKAFSMVHKENDLIRHGYTRTTFARMKNTKGLQNPLDFSFDSLDRPVGDSDDLTLGDTIEADIPAPDKELEKNTMLGILNEALEDLERRNKRWRKVMDLSFGLRGGNALTNQEIGDIDGVSHEMVRGIKSLAKNHIKKYLQTNYPEFVEDLEYVVG